MQCFELNGTIYKITLNRGESWRDTSADTMTRWIPEQRRWAETVISVSHVRSFGTPCDNPAPTRITRASNEY